MSEPRRPRPAFAIKVDVDTHLGLRDGTPRLLEMFARHGVRASWFVSMGPDRTGASVWRVLRQRGFLAKMIRSRAPRLYPLRTMLRGTLLPAVPIAASFPERLREIRAAGHEIGIHGFDHVRWHDQLAHLSDDDVRGEVRRAAELFAEILEERPTAFAAPGWQCTASSLRAIDDLGFRYRSDTRGSAPYRPQADGYLSSLPEVPTTMPTLDEMIGREGHTVEALVAASAAHVSYESLNVHTVHTEVEGGAWLGHLDALLARVRQKMPVRTLAEVVAELPPLDAMPRAEVVAGTLPGRGGSVACQRTPLPVGGEPA